MSEANIIHNKNTNSAIHIHKAKKHLFTIIFLLFFSPSSAQSPKNDTTTSSNSVLESIITYTAEDSIITNVKNKKVYLFNKANIKYEQIELSAGFIEIDWATNTLYATGIKDSLNEISQKPIFIENGQEYKADTISYNLKSKKGLIKKVITDEGEGFLHGEKVKKVDEKDFYISKGGFTTCSHEDPHFTINAKKLKIVVNESTNGLVASGKIREIKKYNPKLKTTPKKTKTTCVEELTLITNGRSVLGLLH